MPAFPKAGLDALLTPDNCVLVLIDHQPFQLANVNSHEPTMVMNNVTGLAKTAKAYGIPTILTTVTEERGGLIFKSIQDLFPDQKTINRTYINAWEDERDDMAIRRLVAAGAQPITWLGMAGELQRDWARTQYLPEVAKIFADHGGATGSVLAWEMQLLRASEVKGA